MDVDLGSHGRRYATNYPPQGHSDHFPMAFLALGGLGASKARRLAFAAEYLPRLVAIRDDDPRRRCQDVLQREVDTRGVTAVLQDRLPRWISGWFRDAYHPLIRIAYGVEFGVVEEVVAGLCYLEACGSSPELAALAHRAGRAPQQSGLDLFHRAAALPPPPDNPADFTAGAEAALAGPLTRDRTLVVNDNLRQISHAALSAFASTHDFFALHLVTASHAFRVVHRYAGPEADAVLNLGLLAGYLAIGAPPIDDLPGQPGPQGLPTRDGLLGLCGNDEHDLKLAYTAWAQSRHWDDGRYLVAAERYLNRG